MQAVRFLSNFHIGFSVSLSKVPAVVWTCCSQVGFCSWDREICPSPSDERIQPRPMRRFRCMEDRYTIVSMKLAVPSQLTPYLQAGGHNIRHCCLIWPTPNGMKMKTLSRGNCNCCIANYFQWVPELSRSRDPSRHLFRFSSTSLMWNPIESNWSSLASEIFASQVGYFVIY